jgi:hypothetical protein
MVRRTILLLLLALPAAMTGPRAQEARPAPADAAAPRGDFWFDPTQLPSFTGTVERYLLNPRGETDALLFREGPQVVFPPDMADPVRRASPPGRPIIVWGIRARSAPVITMLAFAPGTETTPTVVERLYWRPGRVAGEHSARLTVTGLVRLPYYAPQGEVAGAILEDGTVVLVPRGAVERFRELLRPGAELAAEGPGFAGDAGRAVAAERLGEAPRSLRPVVQEPPPAATPRP